MCHILAKLLCTSFAHVIGLAFCRSQYRVVIVAHPVGASIAHNWHRHAGVISFILLFESVQAGRVQ